MTFARPHHRQVARVLESLDANLLRACGCWFGGGTAIALRFGEFRESLDIDFVVSDTTGFRALRQRLRGAHDLAGLTLPGTPPFPTTRELRADQYGIRGFVDAGRTPIKFEIVSEGRVALETPRRSDAVCGIATLGVIDLATTKLLANVDRWRDDSVFARDAIDLAFMPLPPRALAPALAKAGEAYGRDVVKALEQALQSLRERGGWVQRCIAALSLHESPAALVQRLRRLERRLAAAAAAGN
jgi:hypothetical protein